MKEKAVRIYVPREKAKGLTRALRKALETGNIAAVQEMCAKIMGEAAPFSLQAYPVESIPATDPAAPQPPMSPEQEKLEKLYSNVATNTWRIKNQILDAENSGEPKESLSEREIGKIARYVNSLETALANGGVEVVSDYVGKPHREGSAVNVVSKEIRQDLTREEYVEVLLPTVRWTNSKGQTRLLQAADVVVGRPKDAPTENSEDSTI